LRIAGLISIEDVLKDLQATRILSCKTYSTFSTPDTECQPKVSHKTYLLN